jgi:hypothetical protein
MEPMIKIQNNKLFLNRQDFLFYKVLLKDIMELFLLMDKQEREKHLQCKVIMINPKTLVLFQESLIESLNRLKENLKLKLMLFEQVSLNFINSN